jgi:hypothetical protein
MVEEKCIVNDVLINERKNCLGLFFYVLYFEVMFRDCYAEAFGTATAQNRGRVTRVC